jgi:non-ribosomal peptide synthase protein (TIGR01720 family)
VDVSWWACPPSAEAPAVVPIGRPIANTRLYVLDARGELAPVGVPGELFIAGVQVGMGYHARPELTAERFVPDRFAPAGEAANSRMYRTGDRARWLPDGTVEYLGRLDFQVKLRGFRIELGEIEATLLKHPAVRDCVVDARADGEGEKRLVAYLVAAGDAPEPAMLRAFLLETLPDYMVPGAFVVLDVLPLSTNGKVDRRALPDPRLERASRAPEPPRGATEEALAAIWSRVLRVERVGATDDFFELGGDSLLSIQIVSQAARAGLRITLTQVLQHPTVRGQAAVARAFEAAPAAAPGLPARGDVALTPVQRWFAELRTPDAHHWNQAFLFTVPESLDHARLRAAIERVAAHHDALRLRFRDEPQTGWRQWHAPDAVGAIAVTQVDLSAAPDAELSSALAAACDAAQRSLDLERGPIGAAMHVSLGAGRGARLLLVLHHLVVDGVSWRLLREDIESAYEQLGASAAVELPARTSSFAAWSAALGALATSGALNDEKGYWSAQTAAGARSLPVDRKGGENVEGAVRVLEHALSAEETRDLLQRVPAAYGTRVDDVLLAALEGALAGWLGEGSVVVDLEGHGREEIAPGVDVSRTLGWFTSVYPVRLALSPAATPRTRLIEAKETLRRVPRRGIGYGVLRYLAGEPALRDGVRAEVMFNYLGQFDQVVAGSRLFGFAPEPAGAWRSARAARRHLLEIVALVLDGRLVVRFGYAETVHDRTTVERMVESFGATLRGCIAHCLAPDAGGYTPSDFPLAGLDQRALDRLLAGVRDVEDVHPVTPLQRMFLDAAGAGHDPGFQQYRFELSGALDEPVLRDAWRAVIARHPALRSRFVADGGAFHQVVQRDAELPWRTLDWRGATGADARLAALLADDAARGLDVALAPAMRVTLVRLADDRWCMVWTQHHLLLDRWSWPLVLREVGATYDALRSGERPAPRGAVPFRDYVAWLAREPEEDARRYWREELADLGEPLRLLESRAEAGADAGHDEVVVTLDAETTAGLRAAARRSGLAANVLVEGAWAAALAHLGGRDDVTFGLAVDGRGVPVPGADEIVGVLVNNVPARVRLEDDPTVADWLAGLQRRQAQMRAAAHAPLESIQRWIGLPWRHRLFESLLVFQDRSAESGMAGWLGESLRLAAVETPTRTAYPITGLVGGDDRLSVTVLGDRRQVPRALSEQLALGVEAALHAMSSGLDGRVGALRASMPVVRPWGTAAATGAPRVAPRTATERVLARVWSELLGVGEVGTTDNFFALGGHSLLATQIVSRVRDTLQVELPVRALFEGPTVAELARAATAAERKPGEVERIAELVLRVEQMSADELRQSAAAREARATVTVHGD